MSPQTKTEFSTRRLSKAIVLYRYIYSTYRHTYRRHQKHYNAASWVLIQICLGYLKMYRYLQLN